VVIMMMMMEKACVGRDMGASRTRHHHERSRPLLDYYRTYLSPILGVSEYTLISLLFSLLRAGHERRRVDGSFISLHAPHLLFAIIVLLLLLLLHRPSPL
jgi:hypothetical protein